MKIIASLLTGLSLNAVADQDMDSYFSMSPKQLAEISVSIADNQPKPLNQSTAVTSVVTAEQITAMGATHLDEVLATIPGLHINLQAITYDAVYSMRGIYNGVNAQVLVMLNGTRYNVPYKGSYMTGLLIPVEAIAKIEVIRGPASAIYGADAFAGVINIITKNVTDIDGAEVGFRAGNHDTQSGWGLYGGRHHGWDIAASLQYQHMNDDNDRGIAGDFQNQLDQSLGTQASLAPGHFRNRREFWNGHLTLERKHWDLNFWAYATEDAGLHAGSSGVLDKEGELDNQQFLVDLHYSSEDLWQDWRIDVKTSYLNTEFQADLHIFPDNSLLPIDNTGAINFTDVNHLVFFPNGLINDIKIKNQVTEFLTALTYRGWQGHHWQLQGAYRAEQVNTSEQRNYGIGVLTGSETIVTGRLTDVSARNTVFLPDSRRHIWSLALQDEWRFSRDWTLTVGLRYDHYSDFGSTVNPRAALVWNVNDRLVTKLLYGRAFRAPSFLEQKQQNSQLFTGNPDVDPEIINSVEWALAYQPFDELSTSVNLFYYDIDDPIEPSVVNGISKLSNGPGQEGYGTELEFSWNPHRQWLFRGNYAWQYTRNDTSHRRMAQVPEQQFYIAAEWAFAPKWRLQTQLKWIGDRLSLPGDNRPLDEYETVDITLSNNQRLWGFLNVAASVRNVFDSDGRQPSVQAFTEHLPIPSRSFYLEASAHF